MSASSPTPALEALLGEAHWVRDLARGLVRDAHAADDLAQDACVEALRRPPVHASNLRGWMRTVLHNLVRQQRRGDVRRMARERTVMTALPAASTATDLLVRANVHRAVVDAVLALPPAFRDVVLLRYFENEPPRAIALRLQIAVATVHSRLLRAHERLRRRLDTDAEARDWRQALLPLPAVLRSTAVAPSLAILAMNIKSLAAAAAIVVVGFAALWIGLQAPNAAPDTPSPTPPLVRGTEERPAAALGNSDDPGERVAAPAAEPATAPPSPAPSARTVAGRVVDSEGAGAAGIDVRVGKVAGKSDAVGAFVVAVPMAEPLVATADHPGLFTILESLVPAGDNPPPLLVVVAPSVRVAGSVRDVAAARVPGASVQVVWPADLRSRLRDVSDAASERNVSTACSTDGAFAFTTGAVRGAELLVTAPGHLPARRPAPMRDEAGIVVVLEPISGKPGTVQGQVVDAHGRIVAGAQVGLGNALARSDEAGNFVIVDDGRGEGLAAIAAGHRRAFLARAGGFASHVVLQLGGAPLAIHGRVVDQDGKGLPGIVVWPNDATLLCDSREQVLVEGIARGLPTMNDLRARFERGEFAGQNPQQVLRTTPTAGQPWVRTGADGTFTLDGLEDRPYCLRAIDHETLLMCQHDAVPAGARGVRLVLDQSHLFAEVKGVVVARDGTPVPGVRVQVQIDTQSLAGRTQHERAAAVATTDERGAFTLPKVPKAWAYFRLEGDRVIPSEPGRDHNGGLLDLSGGRPHEFRLEVRVRMHVQVELLDPARADAIAVLDGDGQPLILNVFQGRSRSESAELRLAEGRSPVFVVPDTAAVLVLRKAGADVGRETLSLRPGDVNTLRL